MQACLYEPHFYVCEKYFLKQNTETNIFASDSLKSISRLSELHDKNIEKLPKTTRSKDNLRAVFDYIEQYPIIDIKRTAKELEISYNTAATAVKKLVELGILQETTNAERNRVFAYEEYLGILRKDT